MDSLYVDFDGLEENINQLRNWEEGFNELNSRINLKIQELNNVWQGKDYESMRNSISEELRRISGPDGLIQKFLTNSIHDLEQKKGNYASIQSNNAQYWG